MKYNRLQYSPYLIIKNVQIKNYSMEETPVKSKQRMKKAYSKGFKLKEDRC